MKMMTGSKAAGFFCSNEFMRLVSQGEAVRRDEALCVLVGAVAILKKASKSKKGN